MYQNSLSLPRAQCLEIVNLWNKTPIGYAMREDVTGLTNKTNKKDMLNEIKRRCLDLDYFGNDSDLDSPNEIALRVLGIRNKEEKLKCYCLGSRFYMESSTELSTEMSKRNWIHCEELIEQGIGVFAELSTDNL
jgi:hypothetical protein